MIHVTMVSIAVALLSALVSVDPLYGQTTNTSQYDNEEILSFAITHTIQAISSLEAGNSTDVSMHLDVANEQVAEVLSRKLASSSNEG